MTADKPRTIVDREGKPGSAEFPARRLLARELADLVERLDGLSEGDEADQIQAREEHHLGVAERARLNASYSTTLAGRLAGHLVELHDLKPSHASEPLPGEGLGGDSARAWRSGRAKGERARSSTKLLEAGKDAAFARGKSEGEAKRHERHVRVSRRAVEVEVVLLDVLAVVAFAVREPEEPLLQDRIPAVPQGEGEAEARPSSPQRYARERA